MALASGQEVNIQSICRSGEICEISSKSEGAVDCRPSNDLFAGNLYQGAPSLEDTGMLMGMGKRGASMEPVGPSRNPRWNRHHRIQRKDPLQKAFEIRREDLDDMVEEEEGEMVRLVEKRSGLTLPTPNVEDAGMLMGMGKRSSEQFLI